MADLITRQAAVDALERKKDKNAKGDIGGFYNKIIQNDIDALMQLPSAQPEIIHCKECKFAHMTYVGDCKYCDVWFPDESEYLDGDYYCASAERRTDE